MAADNDIEQMTYVGVISKIGMPYHWWWYACTGRSSGPCFDGIESLANLLEITVRVAVFRSIG